MTDEELDAIEARENAATPGPWQWRELPVTASFTLRRLCDAAGDVLLTASCHDSYGGCSGADVEAYHEPDAEFLAAARADVPALVAEVRRLRKIFDDAGQGEHNILALIEHYQDEAIEAWGAVSRLRGELAERDRLEAEAAETHVELYKRLHEAESVAAREPGECGTCGYAPCMCDQQ